MSGLADMAEPEIVPDLDKFRDVVHFICGECSQDELGKTKLHKICYYSDMLAYVETGAPLTGIDYIKQPFGPIAKPLGATLRLLQEDGALQVEARSYFGFNKTDFKLARPFSSNRLSEHDKALIREVIEFVCRHTAREISELSHAKPWSAVNFGERIPYASAFLLLPQKAAAAEDAAWARQQLAHMNPTDSHAAAPR